MKKNALIAPVLAALTLGSLVACGNETTENKAAESTSSAASSAASSSAAADANGTHEVTDAHGKHEVPNNPERVVATDNTVMRVLEKWGVKLVAAPQKILSKNSPYKTDSSIADMGAHREPNLEAMVAANPDLVLTGKRFIEHYDAIVAAVPEAAVIDTDLKSFGENLSVEDALKKQVELLGEVFNRSNDAEALIKDFDEAKNKAVKAYDKETKVMGLVVSGGDINYSAPSKGRGAGPFFDMIGLAPALEVEGATTDHQGDDVSVEAIAQANPDFIIVLDRDAAVKADDPSYQPAEKLLNEAEALKNVKAIQEGKVFYLPADFYLPEGIISYTEILNDLAAKFSEK